MMRKRNNMQRISFIALSFLLVVLVFTRVQENARAEEEAAAAEAAAREALLNPVLATPEPTPEPTIDPNLPDVDVTSWELTLVNDLFYTNYLSSRYAPNVVTIEGRYFDERAVAKLQAMLDAIRAEGLELYLVVGYRSYSSQEYIFNGKASQLSYNGTYTYEEAVEIAKDITAYPGTSEHQLALCCDFTVVKDGNLDEAFYSTEQFDWLIRHCAEYGFIYRYPADRVEETGRKWEPWHFRYVGVESAKYIMEHDLILEEYIQLCLDRDVFGAAVEKESNEQKQYTLIDEYDKDGDGVADSDVLLDNR